MSLANENVASGPALLSTPDVFCLGFINPGSFPFTSHEKRRRNPAPAGHTQALANLCTQGQQRYRQQEVLLHPEKEASEVPLSMSTWGHWCCPGLWDRASASSAAAFTGGGNAQSDNMSVFLLSSSSTLFLFLERQKKEGTPN